MQTFLVQRAGVGRTKLFSDLLHREDDDPYIPGTTVRRMQTVQLGRKAIGVLDTEVQRVQANSLRRHLIERCRRVLHHAPGT